MATWPYPVELSAVSRRSSGARSIAQSGSGLHLCPQNAARLFCGSRPNGYYKAGQTRRDKLKSLAMIPYFELNTITIGPLRVPVFGPLLAIAILTARGRILRTEGGVGPQAVRSMATLCLVMLVCGLFFAHAAKIALDDVSRFLADPATVLRTGQGIRSVGGLYGGLLRHSLV
jgi:hypothetical protein